MLVDSKKLIDIAAFQVKLVEAFDSKGILSSYRNDIIPAPKKSLTVNETKIKKDAGEKKDDPATVNKLSKEFKKVKLTFKEDDEVKKEIDNIALKLAEDTSLKDDKVYSHKDTLEALNKRKAKMCWSCRSMNCLTKQKLCFKHKITKSYVGKCTGKQLTFNDL